MGIFESINLILYTLLIISGAMAVILILKVYYLYQNLRIRRSITTPMLFTGVFIALAGFSELVEPFFDEIGV